MQLNDAIVGVVLVIFAIAEIAYSTTFPTLHGQAYGPSLFPILIGCCLLGCGLVLIVRGLQTRRQQAKLKNTTQSDVAAGTRHNAWIKWGDWASDPNHRMNMLLVPGLLILYILFSESIGFIPLSVLILSILLYRLGSSVLTSVIIAGGTTALLQLLFVKVLLVPLPSGLMPHWLG